ncbi:MULTISPECIES: type II secretion system protein GspD [Campylobacter]|uniref:type II secretion system protein GspD n=1 Tax=Campylobacter TaxID=194 RepID=UPI0015D7D177|nr:MULTISPECIES: type II and III secretion system protein [unclassified Campylobacter]
MFDFANIASTNSKIENLISGDIKAKDFYFFSPYSNSEIDLPVFKKMIEVSGFRLLKFDDFYYVDRVDENLTASNNQELSNLFYIKLKNNSFDEVNSIINMYDRNATYISQDNAVAFKATDKEYSEILSAVSMLDEKDFEQVNFKITILETNLDDLRSRGTEINSLLQGVDSVDFRYFFNLLTVPYTANTNVSNQSSKFYGVLKFLDSNSITKIKSSPFLVAKNSTSVYFSNVRNIPFRTSIRQVQDSQSSTQENFEYKDVGLKLTLKPRIIDEFVYTDIHFVYENLINTDNLTPTTTKKELKSNYKLKKGDILVLSGINEQIENTNRTGIPILKDIWLLKYLFSTQKVEVSNSIISISIEVF